jgi:uncharacterized protein
MATRSRARLDAMNAPAASDRTRLRRHPERGSYDSAAVEAILDAGWVAHVGFVADGQPYVIPTIYVRIGRELFVHGSAASRTLRAAGAGIPLCVTVTLIDGFVLARSAFRHSMNYRSVVVLGTASLVEDTAKKGAVLEALVDRFVQGRSREVRAPSPSELKATSVLGLPIDEASAKVRAGGPVDDEADLALECWAGVLPIRLVVQPAERADGVSPARETPRLSSALL